MRTLTQRAALVIAAFALVTVGATACNTPVSGMAIPVPVPAKATTHGKPGKRTGADVGPCKYLATPNQPSASGHNIGLPDDPTPTPNTGTVTVTFHTNAGDIPVVLDRAEAPCTVQSELFLAAAKFYNNTPCHRLTAYPSPPLDVLQCGDPTGRGSGGPGYTIPDEFPKNLAPAPGTTGSVIYPAGSIAMANTGQAHSGGSQFFLVYGDSYLPPQYTVFGTMSPAGLTVVKQIAAHGITPGTDPSTGQPTPQDGKPQSPVTITSVTR